jgi:multidrug transporter EmrE-like cation transporter
MTVAAAWLSLVSSIIVSILGQTLLKAGASTDNFRAQLSDIRSLAGLCAYGAAALLYMLALRRLPMSVALPFSAASYVAASIIGYFAFQERLNVMQMGAIAVICLGTLMLARGSS